jgi:hypothetical protein
LNIACRKCKGEQLSLTAYSGSLRRILTSLPILFLLSGPILAAPLGMATDHETDKSRYFEIETGIVVATLQESSGRINGDCAVSNDETRGFSSNANQMVSVLQFSKTTLGQSVNLTSIDISNAGVDMSLSPDGALLVTTGAGHVDQPLSIIDTVNLQEVATFAPFLDHTSAEFCDDGTLLVTTTFGNSFASPFDNAMYDARVSPDGEFQLGGNRLSSGAQPNNGSCAPGSKSGVLLDRQAGLTSFTLPGLNKVDFAVLHGGVAVAAVFNRSGDRLYVRTTLSVEAFDFDPINGAMKADWVQSVSYAAEYFGIDQIAIDPDNGDLYVDGDRMLLIMDPENGEQTGLLQAGDATGVCFAQRQPLIPQRLIVSTAP